MKNNKKTIFMVIIGIVLIVLLLMASIYWMNINSDKCTDRDREIGNCVPAGMCHPDPTVNQIIECDVKNYDKKLNPDI